MLRKIVLESMYSPALAANLGAYITTLRAETTRRRLGLLFISLALTVQLFTTLFPPESANAGNPENFVDGGIPSIEAYLQYYDLNTKGIKDLLTSLGITRSDIESTSLTTLDLKENIFVWSTENTAAQSFSPYTFPSSTGDKQAYYAKLRPNDALKAYVGSSRSLGWFALSKQNGNLLTANVSSNRCTASESAVDSSDMSSTNQLTCLDGLSSIISARYVSLNSSVSAEKAQPSDRIIYTISTTNNNETATLVPLSISVKDMLEYSTITDLGGATLNSGNTLSWPATTLSPDETAVKSFVIQIFTEIPSTARGEHVSTSYDCTLQASYGNTLELPVACPLWKTVESLTSKFPLISPITGLSFIAVLTLLSAYLYVRAKALLLQLYHARHNHLGAL